MTPQTMIIDSAQKRDRAVTVLSALPFAKPLLLTIQPYVAKRTTTQNARLWALHSKVGAELGMSAEDLHEIMLCRFFGFEEKKVGGIIRQIPLERSSPLDKKKFADFMTATETFYIQEFGIFLE